MYWGRSTEGGGDGGGQRNKRVPRQDVRGDPHDPITLGQLRLIPAGPDHPDDEGGAQSVTAIRAEPCSLL